ncbi:uncharacterized protein LOC119415504 [Nematolebias whitei]|uniref:uncharacterized protein LOC119415504 n=1 Tax=Nematolebias whitei TaxID=451745 RepID=UPI001899A0B8|nr:uncharacterized protein LOC119415504 [Nematolebias whitei]
MPAGFLVTRLLLVCLLSEVENGFFATAQHVAQPQEWQIVGNPYDYFLSVHQQPIQHMRQPYEQNNPWMKLLEDLTKNRDHPEVVHQPSLHQQIQSPYKRTPQVLVKYPDGVSSQNPAVEAKKVEFNVNIPLQQFIKGLVLTKRGSDMLRDVKEGDWGSPVLYQEGAGGPFWSEHKGLPRDILKRKRTPGINLRFSAPVPVHRDRKPSLHRPENLVHPFSQSELAQKSSPEFGQERPNMHYSQGPHPSYDPAHNLQMAKSDYPLASANWGPVNSGFQQPAQQPERQTLQQAPQQLQPQLPSFRQIFSTGTKEPSVLTRWAEEIAKQLPHIKVSIVNPDSGHGDPSKQAKAPQQRPHEGSGVFPQVRCSPPIQNNRPRLRALCPWLFRPCLTSSRLSA